MGLRRIRRRRKLSASKRRRLVAQVRALPYAERVEALRKLPADLDLWAQALDFSEAELAAALPRILGERP